MQFPIQNSINISSALACRLCRKVALDPLQNQCCTIIVCETCTSATCHHCKKPCSYLKSPFVDHLYKCISIKCPYKCKADLTLNMLKTHMTLCPEATIECPFCKDKDIKIAFFPQHMGIKHQEECSRLLNQFHKIKEAPNNQATSNNHQIKINPFRIGATGMPRICRYGRLTCGGDLGIASNNLFSVKLCSPELGSCLKCMTADKERLGLGQNYLLNLEGRICYYHPERKKVACGITSSNARSRTTCNGVTLCPACEITMSLIQQGLYRPLISSQ